MIDSETTDYKLNSCVPRREQIVTEPVFEIFKARRDFFIVLVLDYQIP